MRSFEPHLKSLASTLLRQLLTPGQMFPDLAQPLAELEQATDWEEATSTGRVVPAKVDFEKGMAGPAGEQGFPWAFHAEKGMGCCSATAALHPLADCGPACKQGLPMVRQDMDWSSSAASATPD